MQGIMWKYEEKISDKIRQAIEGNTLDVCKSKWYVIGDKTIMGYGAAL